jgi:hypothetical protein
LGLEDGAGYQIKEGEFRLGASGAGHTGAGFARLAVLEDAVARRTGHRSAATEFVEQASFARSLSELHGRLLVLEVLVAGATGLRETGEERLRTVEFIEDDVFRPSRR